ncbi:MAG: hypothetical protein ACT4P7_03320 [Gemmatimonadaceae bacterium]
MVRHLSVMLVAVAVFGSEAAAKERNYTIRGDGFFDAGNQRFGRLAMREARLTLRDNGDFAVTLFVRNERYLVRGHWDRRGRGYVEHIDIANAFGQRASGSGSLSYGSNAGTPERLILEGHTADGRFRAEISDARNDEWEGSRDDRRGDFELGRGNRLYRDIDAVTEGNGLLRLSGIRDGRLTTVRAHLGTNRDMRLEFERPTRGTLRAEITNIRHNRVIARVTDVFGYGGSGEIVVTMRDRDIVERINGSGSSGNGSWQLDFDGRSRGRDSDGWDWGSGRDFGFESDDRGSGWLRQDVGPALSFDRMRVTLDQNRDATIQLEGRRQTVRLRGRWSGSGDRLRVELTHVNELRARGRVELTRNASTVESMHGDGQTDSGRFEVRFSR